MKKPNDYSRYKPRPYNEICPESTLKPAEITRDTWLRDVFPEWGRFLNYEIDHYPVPKGEVSMWWVGGSSWVLKTDAGGIFLIDPYAGVSHSTKYPRCDCKAQAGAYRSQEQTEKLARFGFLSPKKLRAQAQDWIERLRVKTTSGNQFNVRDRMDSVHLRNIADTRLKR